MDDRLQHLVRSLHPHHRAAHHRASQAIWQAMAASGDIYLGRYEGWYSVRDEAYYDEEELVVADTGEKLSPQGTPVEWTVEESWFFRLSAYQDRLLAHYERQSRLHPPGGAAQRGDALRRGRPFRPVHLAHQLRLGRQGAGQRQPRHVRVARRAHQLPHRRRLSRRNQRLTSASGRPISTSSARTWCASTPSTGRLS
jgi:hypothetical protein